MDALGRYRTVIILITLMDAYGRLRTLDARVPAFERTGTGRSRSRKKNAISTVVKETVF